MGTFILLGFFFYFLEGLFDSIVDTVDHHQSRSIFSKMKNQKWWNQHQGWKNKYVDYDTDNKAGIEPRRVKWKWVTNITFGLLIVNKPVQLTDSWHFFKTLKIISHTLGTVIFPSVGIWSVIMDFNIWWFIVLTVLSISILGFIRNKTFSIFYDKVWLK